jgi:hypothetical protein
MKLHLQLIKHEICQPVARKGDRFGQYLRYFQPLSEGTFGPVISG